MSESEGRRSQDDNPGPEASFDLPHRRGSALLNTPALVDHFVYWHGKDAPRFAKANTGHRDTPPDVLRELGFTTGRDALLRWDGEGFQRQALGNEWRISDPKALVAAHVNRLLTSILGVENGSGDGLLFTNNYPLCKQSDEARRGESDIAAPDCVYLNRSLARSGSIGVGADRPMQYELIADIHNEYFSVTFRVYPLTAFEAPGALGWPDATSDEDVVKATAAALKVLSEPSKNGRPYEHDALNPIEIGSCLYEAIFDDFWARFYSALLPDRAMMSTLFQPIARERASFRGAVLRSMPIDRQVSCFDPTGAKAFTYTPADKPEAATDRSTIMRPIPPSGFKPVDSVAKSQSDDDELPDDLKNAHPIASPFARRLVRQVNEHAPFFGHVFGFDDGERWVDQTRASNSVFCSFLDGLAVYGSDLGAHSPSRSLETQSARRQIRFVLLYGGPSRDQLGRLLRRLLYCGELRILPLIEFSRIRRAGKTLDALAEDYADLENELSNQPTLKDFRDIDGAEQQNKLYQAALETHQAKVAERLSKSDDSLNSSLKACEGGLKKRVDRCLFYFGLLENWLESLRVGRIEGWQPYDEFISSRVAPPLESMREIPRRLDQIDEIRRRIDNRRLMSELTSTLKSIEGIQQSIQTLNHRNDKNTEALVNLQASAEGFAFLFLIALPLGAASFIAINYLAAPLFADADDSRGFLLIIQAVGTAAFLALVWVALLGSRFVFQKAGAWFRRVRRPLFRREGKKSL